MSHRSTSSTRVRFFRPCLESLEERTLLSFYAYGVFLQQISNAIDQNIAQITTMRNNVSKEIGAVNAAPHNSGAILNLVTDSLELDLQIETVHELVDFFSDMVLNGEVVGLVDNVHPGVSPFISSLNPSTHQTDSIPNPDYESDTEKLDAKVKSYQDTLSGLDQLENVVTGNMLKAAFGAIFNNVPILQPLESQQILSAPPGTVTNGTVAESITAPPSTASSSGGPVSLVVNLQNTSNSTENLLITDHTSNGAYYSQSDSCSNSTISDTLTVPAQSPGVTDTWNVYADGLPTQTYTTTFTA